MRDNTLYDIEELGEESGRDEAACDFPYFPDPAEMETRQMSRVLTHYGRGRAQGRYGLRGKQAKVFALSWRAGYFATYSVFKREGHLEATD